MIHLFLFILALCFPLLTMAQTPPPPWNEKIEMFGDIRVRHEYTSKTKPTDTSESHKERLRLRFGALAKVTDNIKAKIRLASSEGQNSLSTNQTLTDNGNKKGIYIDQAMIEWTAWEAGTFTFGKMENPLRILNTSQILYDTDYTPEGAAFAWNCGSLFTRLGGFSIQERSQQANGTSEPDSWLLAGMAGYKADLSEKLALTVAGGYHNFTALKKNTALAPGASTTAPNFYGNSNAGAAGAARYIHDYQVGELLAELRMKGSHNLTSIYVDALNNFYLDDENRAYIAGVAFQTLNENAKPVWTIGYAYQSVDKDATVSALNNSDFGNGLDGAFGHIIQVGRAFTANTSLNLTWYNVQVDNSGTPYTTDKGLLDFLVAF